jgi:hypothetical protein
MRGVSFNSICGREVSVRSLCLWALGSSSSSRPARGEDRISSPRTNSFITLVPSSSGPCLQNAEYVLVLHHGTYGSPFLEPCGTDRPNCVVQPMAAHHTSLFDVAQYATNAARRSIDSECSSCPHCCGWWRLSIIHI